MKDNENILFYDEEYDVGFISPVPNIRNKWPIRDHTDYEIEYSVFYGEGLYYVNVGETYPGRTIIDICKQLNKLGFDFKQMEPQVLFPNYIEPSDETRLLLILKGIEND